MASKRYKFLLSTSSCFLCFEGISNVDINDSTGNVFSLQSIFQYFNMDLKQIETLSTRPVEILNRTDVRVNLCYSCGEISEEISNLYKSIEVLKIKLDYNLELIQKKVKSSESKNGKLQSINKEMRSTESVTKIRHSKLMEELRQDILNKCDLKMPNYQPRVHLERARDLNKRTISEHQETQKLTEIEAASGVESQLSSSAFQKKFLAWSSTANQENLTPELQTIKQDPLNVEVHDNEDFCSGSEIEADTGHNFKVEQDVQQDETPYLSTGSKDADISEMVIHSSSVATVSNQEIENEKRIVQKDTPELHSKRSSSKHYCIDPVTKMFSCKQCDKNFKSKDSLQSHYYAIHLHRRYKCKGCNKEFKYHNDLTKHKKTCQQRLNQRLAKEKDPRFKFVCELCRKRWDTKRGLSSHRRMVHQNCDRFPCDICGKKFTSNAYLKMHKEAVHFGKKFTCRFCGKIFGITNKRRHEKSCQKKRKVKVENFPN